MLALAKCFNAVCLNLVFGWLLLGAAALFSSLKCSAKGRREAPGLASAATDDFVCGPEKPGVCRQRQGEGGDTENPGGHQGGFDLRPEET